MPKKYDTFAAYLEDVYYNQIISKIKPYLYNNQGRLDLSTSVAPDPYCLQFCFPGLFCGHESGGDSC